MQIGEELTHTTMIVAESSALLYERHCPWILLKKSKTALEGFTLVGGEYMGGEGRG